MQSATVQPLTKGQILRPSQPWLVLEGRVTTILDKEEEHISISMPGNPNTAAFAGDPKPSGGGSSGAGAAQSRLRKKVTDVLRSGVMSRGEGEEAGQGDGVAPEEDGKHRLVRQASERSWVVAASSLQNEGDKYDFDTGQGLRADGVVFG